jgi:hypothetical protein
MAIVIIGETICPLCGKPILEEDKVELFMNFVPNMLDRISVFSDSAVHIDCLNMHPLKNDALFFKNMAYQNRPSLNSICIVDGKPISNKGDTIFFGLLTSDKNEELFKFNFLTLNKRNVPNWNQREEFICLAINFKNMGKWKSLTEFNFLDYLVDVMRECAL